MLEAGYSKGDIATAYEGEVKVGYCKWVGQGEGQLAPEVESRGMVRVLYGLETPILLVPQFALDSVFGGPKISMLLRNVGVMY